MTDDIILTKDVFQIDAKEWCNEIETFIKNKTAEFHSDGIVVTISGGLDSSVTVALCVRAIGKDKVTGLMLPERLGNPEAEHYGRMIAKKLGIKVVRINISPILRGLGTSNLLLAAVSGRSFWKDKVNRFMHRRGHSTRKDYIDTLKGTLEPEWRRMLAKVTSKQRARVLVAYKYAEENNLLVVGSAHRTERMLGIFCKYGIDDCADLMPLSNIYRSHILQLAKHLDIPHEIVLRSPNPDILPGVTDKYMSYFGMDSQKLDLILYGFQKGLSSAKIANQLGMNERSVMEIKEIIRLSQFFRNHALVPELFIND